MVSLLTVNISPPFTGNVPSYWGYEVSISPHSIPVLPSLPNPPPVLLLLPAPSCISICLALQLRAFPGGSVVKNPPAIQERWVQPLGREEPLEKEMATPSSILAWRIPWTEEPGGLRSMWLQRVGHTLVTKQRHSLSTRFPARSLG